MTNVQDAVLPGYELTPSDVADTIRVCCERCG
jgi:hypothetical protein